MKYYYSVMLCCATIITNSQNIKLFDSLYEVKNSSEVELLYEQSLYENITNIAPYELLFEKAIYLKQIKKYDKAIETLVRINENDLSDSLKFNYYYQLSILNYLINNHAEVELNLNKVKYFIQDTSYKNRLVLLEVLNLNKSKKWLEAKSLLLESNKNKIDSNLINNLYKVALGYKPKSNSKAVALQTFLPGAGQIYIGKPLHGAINTLLILSGLTWGAYNVYNGYYVTSVFSGFVFSYLFYTGGIEYTESNVAKYNTKKVNDVNHTLNSELIKLLN